VRYADTDAAGIVHYARYLGYLEAAGAEALRTVGLSSEMIVTYRVHTSLLQVIMRYRAPAHFDDLLDVHTWVVDVSESQFRFGHEIQRAADQVLIATSQTVHTWNHPQSPVGVNSPDWLRAALNQLRD
jgi:acyl-CoA thioester hydrolase